MTPESRRRCGTPPNSTPRSPLDVLRTASRRNSNTLSLPPAQYFATFTGALACNTHRGAIDTGD